jgi:hypothetical protein
MRSTAEGDRRANIYRSGRKLRTRKIDPLLPFNIDHMNERGAQESGLRLKASVRTRPKS